MSSGEIYTAAHLLRNKIATNMPVVKIDESLALWAGKVATAEDKTLQDFVNLAVRDSLRKRNAERSDEEKIRRFADSYSTFPQKADECEIWLDEQVWEDE